MNGNPIIVLTVAKHAVTVIIKCRLGKIVLARISTDCDTIRKFIENTVFSVQDIDIKLTKRYTAEFLHPQLHFTIMAEKVYQRETCNHYLVR